jgi:hypothetical protein
MPTERRVWVNRLDPMIHLGIEHRDEIRKAFAATHELITHLHGEMIADIAGLRDEVRRNHAAVIAEFEKLTKPD